MRAATALARRGDRVVVALARRLAVLGRFEAFRRSTCRVLGAWALALSPASRGAAAVRAQRSRPWKLRPHSGQT